MVQDSLSHTGRGMHYTFESVGSVRVPCLFLVVSSDRLRDRLQGACHNCVHALRTASHVVSFALGVYHVGRCTSIHQQKQGRCRRRDGKV
jgi:hypothetical protein